MLLARLRAVTTPRQQRWWTRPNPEHVFVGHVEADTFTLVPIIRGRNTYLPRVRGRLRARPEGGSELNLTMAVHPVGVVAILALSSVILISALRGREYLAAFCILVVLALMHALMCLFGFVPEAIRAEDHLRRVAA